MYRRSVGINVNRIGGGGGGGGGGPKGVSNINSAYFIHIMPKIGGAKAPSASPGSYAYVSTARKTFFESLFLIKQTSITGCILITWLQGHSIKMRRIVHS